MNNNSQSEPASNDFYDTEAFFAYCEYIVAQDEDQDVCLPDRTRHVEPSDIDFFQRWLRAFLITKKHQREDLNLVHGSYIAFFAETYEFHQLEETLSPEQFITELKKVFPVGKRTVHGCQLGPRFYQANFKEY